MMKKLLTLTLGVVVLVAFTGVSAAQEKKAPVGPASTKAADKLELSATKNLESRAGCPVTARPYLSNTQFIFPGWDVKFVWVSGQLKFPVPRPGKTDSKGELRVIVPWNTTIRAELPNTKPLVKSNNFTCGDPTK